MLTSNNYLGSPTIRACARRRRRRSTGGAPAWRPCGSSAGRRRSTRSSRPRSPPFFGTEDAILYMSCWNANEGLFAAILEEPDGLYSDELNHASIIDGVRLCKAKRYRVPHSDMTGASSAMLAEDTTSRFRLMMTDGVFSMEGEEARPAPSSSGSAREKDDAPRRWTTPTRPASSARPAAARPEEQGVMDRIAVITGTLGKAMGSAAGGFATGRRRSSRRSAQRSRPYLFSNSLPPVGRRRIARSVPDAARGPGARPQSSADNAALLPQGDVGGGLQIPHGTHPIVPVIVGDTAKALAMGKALLDEGDLRLRVPDYPSSRRRRRRLRCQVSARPRSAGTLDRRASGRLAESKSRQFCTRTPSTRRRSDQGRPTRFESFLRAFRTQQARRGRRRRRCAREDAPPPTPVLQRRIELLAEVELLEQRRLLHVQDGGRRRRRTKAMRHAPERASAPRGPSSRASRREAPTLPGALLLLPCASRPRSAFIIPPIQIGEVVETGRYAPTAQESACAPASCAMKARKTPTSTGAQGEVLRQEALDDRRHERRLRRGELRAADAVQLAAHR